MDDIIIWGESTEIHDRRLRAVLQRCRDVNLKLNPTKCKMGVSELTFLGDVVSAEGLKTDPEKVRAIDEMEKPQNVKGTPTLPWNGELSQSLCARPVHKGSTTSRIARQEERVVLVK